MKIQIASDLHLEFLHQSFPDFLGLAQTDADLLILAGDVHIGTAAMDAFGSWPVPVIYVHGNHEMYGLNYSETIGKLRALSGQGSVHYLEQDEFCLDGVRVLGACLWTDYLLYGEIRQKVCMDKADADISDHRLIKTDGGVFSTDDALRCHQDTLAWLDRKLGEPFSGKTVVVSHHAPHTKSIHPRFVGDLLTAAFASDLSALIAKHQPALWCHGHMHDGSDYMLGDTRVVANPRGYPIRPGACTAAELRFENPEFQPGLVVEIG